jgi:hypothetical protein
MHTLDCWRLSNGELTVLCTGSTTAPIAIDLETGTNVTLHPAQINADMARFGIASVSRGAHGCTGNAWWADLPIGAERTEARLALVVDGVVTNVNARWPEPEPEPEPAAKPKRPRKKA